jgi:proteasome lid subunit RPN8/RPN11
VTLSEEIRAAIIAHARDGLPNECCGLLLARDGVIVEAVRARNALDSPTAYVLDPEDHFAAIRRGRREGLSVVGAYHSHPRSPAVPSPRDVAEAHDPDLLYVIVSLEGPEPAVRAWRIVNGSTQEIL